jgi:hypothetical protein
MDDRIVRFSDLSDNVRTDSAGVGASLKEPSAGGSNCTSWQGAVLRDMLQVLDHLVDDATSFTVPLCATRFNTLIGKAKFLFRFCRIVSDGFDKVIINRERFRQDTYCPIFLPDAQEL